MRNLHVLNLGAGVQSSALYLMAREGSVPCDVAVFADTGEEPAATDLICDLLHLAERSGFDPQRLLERANSHYHTETFLEE